MSTPADVLTCMACRLTFTGPEDQKAHYKSEFHRFNLKRKVADLPPVSLELFNAKVNAIVKKEDATAKQAVFKCTVCKKSFNTENTYQTHLKSRKHKEQEIAAASKPEEEEDEDVSEEEDEKTTTTATQEETPTPSPTPIAPAAPTIETDSKDAASDSTENKDLTEKEIEALIDEKIKNSVRLELTDCLFCQNKSESMEDNLDHMTREHGFFIPDIEYLTDMKGFIQYLGEKVSIGNVCLWCNGKGRALGSLQAVQSHMRDLSHCKLAWDDNEDEYVDFYDYSTSHADSASVPADSEVSVTSKVAVADNGLELMFADGRIVGHRTLSIYYKQRVKPQESRECVLINKLLHQYRALGWYDNYKLTSHERQREKMIMRKQQKQWMKVGVNCNRLQRFMRSQIDF